MSIPSRALALFVLCGLSATAAADLESDFAKAASAHKHGEYRLAAQLWGKLAERGEVNAQFNLAQMYRYGDGIPSDPASAAKWYRKAAEQGDKAAQYNLGAMYLTGEGVAQDEKEAHRWFTLNRAHHAHHQHEPKFVAWQAQAREILAFEERREAYEHSRHDSARIIAELKARAGLTDAPTHLATNLPR